MQDDYSTVSLKVNNLFQQSIPPRPYCSNNLSHGLKVYPKERSLSFNHIQFNPINSVNILNIDLDYDSYPHDLSPLPNLVVYNQGNGRAHAMFMLEAPIHMNDNSSLAAQKYLSAVQNGLTVALKGDPNYAGLISKNPLSGSYRAIAMNDRVWSLDHLAEYIKPITKKVTSADQVGFGRNCYVFNSAREWAYKAIRDFKDLSLDNFAIATLRHCLELNTRFPTGLHYTEVANIAKSISKWVWKERFNLTSFSKQVARAKKLSVKRNETKLFNQQRAINMMTLNYTVTEIAKELNVTRQTVWNYLKIIPS